MTLAMNPGKQGIVPCLWFDNQALEAAQLYTGLFPDSAIEQVSRYPADSMGTEGAVMTVAMRVFGLRLLALNGGPHFQLSPAMSLVVHCDSQEELDRYWEGLLQGGGAASQCGWLRDCYGLSWQVLPRRLGDIFSAGGETAKKLWQAIAPLQKIDFAVIDRVMAV